MPVFGRAQRLSTLGGMIWLVAVVSSIDAENGYPVVSQPGRYETIALALRCSATQRELLSTCPRRLGLLDSRARLRNRSPVKKKRNLTADTGHEGAAGQRRSPAGAIREAV